MSGAAATIAAAKTAIGTGDFAIMGADGAGGESALTIAMGGGIAAQAKAATNAHAAAGTTATILLGFDQQVTTNIGSQVVASTDGCPLDIGITGGAQVNVLGMQAAVVIGGAAGTFSTTAVAAANINLPWSGLAFCFSILLLVKQAKGKT